VKARTGNSESKVFLQTTVAMIISQNKCSLFSFKKNVDGPKTKQMKNVNKITTIGKIYIPKMIQHQKYIADQN